MRYIKMRMPSKRKTSIKRSGNKPKKITYSYLNWVERLFEYEKVLTDPKYIPT